MEIVLEEQQWDAIIGILKEQPYYITAELIAEIEDQMEQCVIEEMTDALSSLSGKDE